MSRKYTMLMPQRRDTTAAVGRAIMDDKTNDFFPAQGKMTFYQLNL